MVWCVVWRCTARRVIFAGLNISQSRHPDCPVGGLLSGRVCSAAFAAATCRRPSTLSARSPRQALPIPANYYDDLLARYGEAVDVATCNVCILL